MIEYNDWQLGNDMDSVEFMLDGKVVMTEFLDKVVEEWAEFTNEELIKI